MAEEVRGEAKKLAAILGVGTLWGAKEKKGASKSAVAIEDRFVIPAVPFDYATLFRDCSKEERASFLERLATANTTLMNMLAGSITLLNALGPGTDGGVSLFFAEAFVAEGGKARVVKAGELVKDLVAPTAGAAALQLFNAATLWSRVQQCTEHAYRAADACLDALAPAEVATVKEQTPSTQTFKEFFMARLTETYADDLDALRQEPNFDGAKVSALVDVLQLGRDIFSADEQRLWLDDAMQE